MPFNKSKQKLLLMNVKKGGLRGRQTVQGYDFTTKITTVTLVSLYKTHSIYVLCVSVIKVITPGLPYSLRSLVFLKIQRVNGAYSLGRNQKGNINS